MANSDQGYGQYIHIKPLAQYGCPYQEHLDATWLHNPRYKNILWIPFWTPFQSWSTATVGTDPNCDGTCTLIVLGLHVRDKKMDYRPSPPCIATSTPTVIVPPRYHFYRIYRHYIPCCGFVLMVRQEPVILLRCKI